MTNATEYIAIPRELLEDRRTQGVHNIINDSHQAKSLREKEQEKIRMAAIDAQDAHSAAMLHLAAESTCVVAGIATLVVLTHIGALAGWVMHISTMALAGWLGHEIGRTNENRR